MVMLFVVVVLSLTFLVFALLFPLVALLIAENLLLKYVYLALHYLFVIPEKPDAPEGPIKFTDIQKTSITFAWKPSPYDGGSPITGYILEYRESWKITWSPLKVVKPDITSYCVQNLKEGTEYFFRVVAENAVGKSEPLDSAGVTAKSPFSKLTILCMFAF